MSFTMEEHCRLGNGRIFICISWRNVLTHAARVINRPLRDHTEAYELLRLYTRPFNTSFPEPDELDIFLVAHRLLFVR